MAFPLPRILKYHCTVAWLRVTSSLRLCSLEVQPPDLDGVLGIACLPDLEVHPPAPVSAHRDLFRTFVTQHQFASLHAVDSSTSNPSDFDGVSPYELPPLLAVARSQTISPLPTTNQRSVSTAYHAVAWSSPYATSSPAQSPTSNSV